MAIEQVNEHLHHYSFLLDALYCEEGEEKWGDFDNDDDDDEQEGLDEETDFKSSLFPLLLSEEDLFWEDGELITLFNKEKETHCSFNVIETNPSLCEARGISVGWILKVSARYGFSSLTAILAVNFLDRFLSTLHYQQDKPWMIQLAAVTCLSLAAKVEETDVPLLLDLQIEGAKYVFEPKTVQKMELLVLSTLKWKMNPVTPLSFLDHILRRLGLKNYLHWEFLKRCQSLVLSIVADSRFVRYLPSVLATATMLHVIHQVEPSNAIEYQNQLLGVLKINKDKVNACYELISNLQNDPHKRKHNNNNHQVPSSHSGDIDTLLFSSDSSNDSWDEVGLASISSSPKPLFKKSRMVYEQPQMPLQPSLNCKVVIDAVGNRSPR